MALNISSMCLYLGLSLITGMGAFIARGLLNRLAEVEKRMLETISEPRVRQLLNDRYDPVLEDIKEIKETVNKLFDLYLDSIKGKTD